MAGITYCIVVHDVNIGGCSYICVCVRRILLLLIMVPRLYSLGTIISNRSMCDKTSMYMKVLCTSVILIYPN